MAMTLVSKQGKCRRDSRKENKIKLSSTVPKYIYAMQKNAKEVASAVEYSTTNKK